MEVTPDQSACSRSPTPSTASKSDNQRENLTEDLDEEGVAYSHELAAGRPGRKRNSVTRYADQEATSRSTRKRGAEEEEDSKPAAQPFPIGVKIRKQFDEGDFEGRVTSGPVVVKGDLVWRVKYTDGDEEDMNSKDIVACQVNGQFSETSYEEDATHTARRGKRGTIATQPRQRHMKEYDTALRDLKWRMGITEEEIKAALDQMQSPYGLNEAMHRIHQARNPESYAPRKKFKIEKGLRVRKNMLGSTYYGTVSNDKPKKCEVPDVFGVTKEVKVWEVTFDDGDVEDFEFCELLACDANRPIQQHPRNGRQLCSLELFSGCSIVTQHFAERKWIVRSVDNLEDSYATDKVDIMGIQFSNIDMVPDFIWASPPCTTYTLMTGGKHRANAPGQFEKTPDARTHNRYLLQMCAIMKWAKRKNPHVILVIENPQGLLSKMPLMKQIEKDLDLKRTTVDYCAFGRDDKKPTHLWTNDWKLSKVLSDCRCDERCPYNQGSHPIGTKQNGHQYNAAAIPEDLAELVADEVHARFVDLRIRKTTKQIILTEEEIEEFNYMLSGPL